MGERTLPSFQAGYLESDEINQKGQIMARSKPIEIVSTVDTIWYDGKEWILYTEDKKTMREIEGWGAFKDNRVRVQATYYGNWDQHTRGIYYARQYVFPTSVLSRVTRKVGIKVNRAELKKDAKGGDPDVEI